jgi:hypothetical protein
MARLRLEITPQEEYTARKIQETVGHATLSAVEVASYLGVSRHTAAKWLLEVDAIVVNGRRRYQAIDLARKLEASRERAAV